MGYDGYLHLTFDLGLGRLVKLRPRTGTAFVYKPGSTKCDLIKVNKGYTGLGAHDRDSVQDREMHILAGGMHGHAWHCVCKCAFSIVQVPSGSVK